MLGKGLDDLITVEYFVCYYYIRRKLAWEYCFTRSNAMPCAIKHLNDGVLPL